MTTTLPPEPSTARFQIMRTSADRATTSWFRVVWRWHFYAGMLVAPIVCLLAVTGGLYLYGAEVHDTLYRQVVFVAESGTPESLDLQIEAALQAVPKAEFSSVEVPVDRDRATIVTVHDADDSKQLKRVYVDPYAATVQGVLDADEPIGKFFFIVLELHRTLLVGASGRLITELVTSWTLLLFLSGVYLWWPRRKEKKWGVWLPRLQAKRYTLLRDLHAICGIYVFPILLVIAGSGLFYTLVWGKAFHLGSRQVFQLLASDAEASPESAKVEVAKKSHAKPESPSEVAATPLALSFDQTLAIARSHYPGRNLGISPPRKNRRDYSVSALNDYARGTYGPMRSTTFQVNGDTGAVTGVQDLKHNDRYWWHCWAYPLHVGTIGGPATKIVWLLACGVLALMPVTGWWMWWQRRPQGKLGLPRRPNRKLSWSIRGLLLLLVMCLPATAVSLLMILSLDWLIERLWRRRTAMA